MTKAYELVRFAYDFNANEGDSSATPMILRRYPAGGTETGTTGLRSRGAWQEVPITVFEDVRSDQRNLGDDGAENLGERTVYLTIEVYPTDGPTQRPADVLFFVDGIRAGQAWQVTRVDPWEQVRDGYAVRIRYTGLLRSSKTFV